MILSSTFTNVRKLYSLEDSVKYMAKAGFDAVDFSFFEEQYYGPETDSDAFRDSFLHLRRFAEENGIFFNQGHAPFPTSSPDEADTEKQFENIVRSLRNASYLGIPLVVVHPMAHLPYYKDGMPEKLFELNMDFYNRLLPYAKKYNVKIGVENMYQTMPNLKIVRHVCATPAEFIRYMDNLDPEWFTACLDIGHAYLVCEKPADVIRALGPDRLGTLHVHDVDGFKDLHTLPYHGKIDWDETCTALREIGYKGDFTFEADYYLPPIPTELYPYAIRLMVETGRHLIRKIER